MKNKWLYFAKKKYLKIVNNWLERAIHDPNELSYALYGIFNVVYDEYEKYFLFKLQDDKKDIAQDCVCEMLRYTNIPNKDYSINLFSACVAITTNVIMSNHALKIHNTGNDVENNLAEIMYNKLKEHRKI